jgi:hypothetical protein
MAGYGGYKGAFLPTTNIWDTAVLEDIDVTKPEFIELLIRMYQNLNLMAQVINIKDSGYYYPQEFVNGQKFWPNPNWSYSSTESQAARNAFRILVNFGALPNASVKSVPHGIPITPNTTFTRIYGSSTNPTTLNGIPISYASASGNNIELYVDPVNVNVVTNSATWIGYTVTYIIIEYLKT